VCAAPRTQPNPSHNPLDLPPPPGFARMSKPKMTGPCDHCGVKARPRWFSGPPEKPCLCSSCVGHWRTYGSMVVCPLAVGAKVRPPRAPDGGIG
jgi:hypothetical protein